MGNVVCFGLLTLDHLLTVERLPKPNEKIPALKEIFTFGGPAANAAATCAVLGSPTRLITSIGDSAFTFSALDQVKRWGVNVQDLRSGEVGTPALSSILITESTGDRAVISRNAAGIKPTKNTDFSYLNDASVLLIDGHHMDLAIKYAKVAREWGILTVFDGGSWKEGTEDLLEYVDVALLSADFRVPSRIDPLTFVRGFGCQVAAQSSGAGPISVLVGKNRFKIETAHVSNIVDTLGAGDVLHGALVHYLFQSGSTRNTLSEARIYEALKNASEVASYSCQFDGAHGWFDSNWNATGFVTVPPSH